MNITGKSLEEEKEYLSKTTETIRLLIDQIDVSIEDKKTEINEMKKYLWDNRSVLDETEIVSGMYNVNLDVGYANEDIKKLRRLESSLKSPYFGRVDFETNNKKDIIYVGLNSISQDGNFYVFDWRSPIASLFYNYTKGSASYQAPMGEIEGRISLKRQYKINAEKIERCFDSELNIDDDYLQDILASSSSDKMTNIVNTIQREQNEIIRNITDKYLIVQGIAGSGKTSVALHRIAYLLYKQKNLNSNNVLIFSPNDIFSEYISNVLPELGEDNVLNSSFSDFASSYIKGFKRIESFTAFVERFYKEEISNKEQELIRYKLSDEFKKVLDKKLEDLKTNIAFERGIILRKKEISKEKMNYLLRDKFANYYLKERTSAIVEYLCETNNISYRKYNKVMKEQLNNLLNETLDPQMIYEDILLSEEIKTKFDIKEKTLFNNSFLNYEDLLAIMYLYFELNSYPSNNSIRHVIIDEAQDYSLIQFEILKKIFKNSSFTILGDIHQTINSYYKYKNLNEINNLFNDEARYIELKKTYRSSREIIDFSNKILGINNAYSIRKESSIPVVYNQSKLVEQ